MILYEYILRIVNSCLLLGYFIPEWKHAVVSPLLKKAGLDESVPPNYQPVSNLPFLSKILERFLREHTTELEKPTLE